MRAGDLLAVVWSVVLLLGTGAGLKRAGFTTTTARVERWCRPRSTVRTARSGESRTSQCVRAVDVAADLVPGYVSCLPRSIVIRALLRHVGLPAELRIGVRREAGQLSAHAWVELDGVPVNDSPEVVAQFAPFDEPVTPSFIAAMR